MNKDDEFNFDNLNDYCLLQILEFLDLKCKLKLHLTSKRLNRLTKRWFSQQKALGDTEYTQVQLCDRKEHVLDEYQYSLSTIIDGNNSIKGWDLNINVLNSLFQLTKNIECLHFSCLDEENLISQRLIFPILLNLPKLKCLSFGIGLQIPSKSWSSIVDNLGNQLEHLQVNRVNFPTLERIVKKCPNLISLYIRFCPTSVNVLIYLWPKLRRLKIASMSNIYIRNNMFTERTRRIARPVERDEETINLAIDDEEGRNRPSSNARRTTRFLNNYNRYWYLSLVELRLNRITLRSLTVIFNHCVSLKVLDISLFFDRIITFENQDFIQLSHRLNSMRFFALDVFNKWNIIRLDLGLGAMFQEWNKLEVLIIKRGLISNNLFELIKSSCKRLKVISIEFSDCVPYNHRFSEITDKVVDSLLEFTELKKLRLHFTGITDRGVIKLVQKHEKLKYLDLFGCLNVTEKSLEAIVAKLNRANKCGLMLNDKNQQKNNQHNLDNMKLNTDSIQSIDSEKSEDHQEQHSSKENVRCCKQFDTVTSNCIDCNKTPQTFYLDINRTKIDLKNNKTKIPNTLFIVNENDEVWNQIWNYPCQLD